MKYYSYSIRIDAPLDAVWAFLTDLHRRAEWEHGVRTVLSVDDGPIGVNTTFKERLKIFAVFHIEGEWRISQFATRSLCEYKGRLPIIGAATVRYTVEPGEVGSLCTVQFYYEPHKGIAGALLDKLIVGPRMARALRLNLRAMKRLVEAGPVPV